MSEEKTKSLVSLTEDTMELLDKIYELEQEGEGIPESLEIALSEALTLQASKVDRCSRFVSYCKHQQEFLRDQKKKIDAEIKRLETHQERMKYIAARCMDTEGVDKLTGLEGSSFSRRKSTSVNVTDLNALPGEFQLLEIKPKKKELLSALRSGEEIAGAELQSKISIVVK